MDLHDYWGAEGPLGEPWDVKVDDFFSSRNQHDFKLDFEPQNVSFWALLSLNAAPFWASKQVLGPPWAIFEPMAHFELILELILRSELQLEW